MSLKLENTLIRTIIPLAPPKVINLLNCSELKIPITEFVANSFKLVDIFMYLRNFNAVYVLFKGTTALLKCFPAVMARDIILIVLCLHKFQAFKQQHL